MPTCYTGDPRQAPPPLLLSCFEQEHISTTPPQKTGHLGASFLCWLPDTIHRSCQSMMAPGAGPGDPRRAQATESELQSHVGCCMDSPTWALDGFPSGLPTPAKALAAPRIEASRQDKSASGWRAWPLLLQPSKSLLWEVLPRTSALVTRGLEPGKSQGSATAESPA